MKYYLSLFVCQLSLASGLTTGQEFSEQQPTETKSDSRAAATEAGQLYWIFLTTGKSTDGVDREKIQEMQAAHLANFKALAEMEKLLTAGPMSDPEKKLRGIVVVRAKTRDELLSFFEDDPYIQNGYLKIEATEMQFVHGVINTKITPQGLDEYRIVVLEKNGDEKIQSEDKAKLNRAFLDRMSENKGLLLTVLLPNSKSEHAAVLVMAKAENDKITKAVQKIPAVKAGIWKFRIFPLYMGKGTLAASKTAS